MNDNSSIPHQPHTGRALSKGITAASVVKRPYDRNGELGHTDGRKRAPNHARPQLVGLISNEGWPKGMGAESPIERRKHPTREY